MNTNTDRDFIPRGQPEERSIWRRKLSGNLWRVLWHSERGVFIRLQCEGYVESECHHPEDFLANFDPVLVA